MSFDLAKHKPVSGGFDLATARPVMGPKYVPDSTPAAAKQYQPSPSAQSTLGRLGSLLPDPAKVEGALEAGLSMGTAATTGVLGRAGGMLGGIAGQVATGQLGTQAGAAEAARTAEEGQAKLTFTGGRSAQEYLDMVQRAIEISKVQGLGPTEAIAMASAPIKGAGGVKQALAPEAEALK